MMRPHTHNTHKHIVIMAGGTGGHVFPALAVAQYLLLKQWRVSWIGTKNGMERQVVSAHGIDMDYLAVQGLRGKNYVTKINNTWLLIKSCWQAMNILRKRKPNVVLGMGGYVAGPAGIVAILLNIPLIIHEQNRIPGITNRLLKNQANKVLEGFPNSFSANTQALFTGNPLRSDFSHFTKKELWNDHAKRDFRLLIVGGSLGAKILNDVVPAALAQLKNITVMHQTGRASLATVQQKYADYSITAQVIDFIDDMAGAYQWGDMIICRAGAVTVSEIAAAGLPAIFIPLPAIDGHQNANAKYLSDNNAAILLKQQELNATVLVQAIQHVKRSLFSMSVAAKKQAKLEATRLVAEHCEQVAGK